MKLKALVSEEMNAYVYLRARCVNGGQNRNERISSCSFILRRLLLYQRIIKQNSAQYAQRQLLASETVVVVFPQSKLKLM